MNHITNLQTTEHFSTSHRTVTNDIQQFIFKAEREHESKEGKKRDAQNTTL